jgi:hypothetical protein
MAKKASRGHSGHGVALLVGLIVAFVARIVVIALLVLSVWLAGNILWASRVPDELQLSPVWVEMLATSPMFWLAYLLWGAVASMAAWRFRENRRLQHRVLLLCWALLLLQSGWVFQLLEAAAVLMGLRPMYPHGWRVVAEGLVLLPIEPSVTGVAILRLPRWLQSLQAPIHNLLDARW